MGVSWFVERGLSAVTIDLIAVAAVVKESVCIDPTFCY